jgi:hypothetical protein
MLRVLSLLLCAASLYATEIRGTVVEKQTGYPLARATVTLTPVGSSTGPHVTTSPSGIFAFTGLAPGSYVLSAEHIAFAPVQYGQKRWPARGAPIAIEEGDSASLTIRMPRFGAITGKVLDENDIGLPEHDLAVYSDTRPPKLLGRARTDDRGVYRFGELRPGTYLVRSLSKMYDGGGYLPTFYRDSSAAGDARPVQVSLDEQIDQVDFHPIPGRLFTVSGRVTGGFRQAVSVTLASDTGTEGAAVASDGTFTFHPVAPGNYELFALSEADRYRVKMAGFRTVTADRDNGDWIISLAPLPAVQFAFEDQAGHVIEGRDIGVVVRRKSPAGEHTEERLVTGGVELAPGHWEIALAPNTTWSVVGPDAWRDVLLTGGPVTVKFVLSSTLATLSGMVKDANGDPLGGATVFVQGDPAGPAHSASTDPNGRYTIGGLAPGNYHVLASFAYLLSISPEVDIARGQTVKIEEGSRAVLDLEESAMH